jgi:glutaminyl-tRNA synthetase
MSTADKTPGSRKDPNAKNMDSRTERRAARSDFIREAVQDHVRTGRYRQVVTRFPPEPNGYLHIGHAKAFGIDFGIAQEFGGRCHLRMDDTNPVVEEQEFIDNIKKDIRWFGFDWGEHEYHASDYFETLYEWARQMIEAGKAYVCDLSADEIRDYRGTLTRPGRDSPYRNRNVEENLDLFERMRKGEFPDGTRTLRAKIDMAHPNVTMRDPVMYRILHEEHPRTGRQWCIYPMYDWSHGQNDWMEGITHSICTLEYEIHRPLYDWFIDTLMSIGVRPAGVDYRPVQIEFARLNLTYTMMSKRKLRALVEEGIVRGWDDPRMPTLCGMRRRGYTPEGIKEFLRRIGVAKFDGVNDVALLEACLRDDLNKHAPRAMVVLKPLRLVIDNYPEGQVEQLDAVNNPEDASAGTRKVPFGKVLYIEQDDFREVPPPKYFRMYPGQEVRLRYAYYVRCVGAEKDAAGNIIAVHCTYDPATRGGDSPDGRKVRSTIHWVSADHAVDGEVRLYDRLFTAKEPEDVPEGGDWHQNINPNSLEVVPAAKLEPSLAGARPGECFQFERNGYFCVDPDSKAGALMFNRTVTLKDTWARIEQRQQPSVASKPAKGHKVEKRADKPK